MADAKVSEFPLVTSLTGADKFLVLSSGANKLATATQIKAFTNSGLVTTVVSSGDIDLSADVVVVAGNCNLPNPTTAKRIFIFSDGASSYTVTGPGIPSGQLVIPNRFAFVELMWVPQSNTVWYVLLQSDVTFG